MDLLYGETVIIDQLVSIIFGSRMPASLQDAPSKRIERSSVCTTGRSIV